MDKYVNKDQLKEIQIEILKEIKRVCAENNISFFLDSGTLLGAVRHKGMIPWDDDIDLGMLREDYEKFANLVSELDDSFFYQSWNSDPNYGLPYAKVRKKHTHFIESTNKDSGQNDGIFVDIFPYDNYPDSRVKQFVYEQKLYLISKLLLAKCGYAVWLKEDGRENVVKKLTYRIIKILSGLFSKDRLIFWYHKIVVKCNREDTGCYVPQSGDGRFKKWILPKSCLDGFMELEFENELYPCPQNYDLYLKSFYGDYMTLPPLEERTSNHSVIKVIIDEES